MGSGRRSTTLNHSEVEESCRSLLRLACVPDLNFHMQFRGSFGHAGTYVGHRGNTEVGWHPGPFSGVSPNLTPSCPFIFARQPPASSSPHSWTALTAYAGLPHEPRTAQCGFRGLRRAQAAASLGTPGFFSQGISGNLRNSASTRTSTKKKRAPPCQSPQHKAWEGESAGTSCRACHSDSGASGASPAWPGLIVINIRIVLPIFFYYYEH